MTRRSMIAGGAAMLAVRASAQPKTPPMLGGLFLSDASSYNWKRLQKTCILWAMSRAPASDMRDGLRIARRSCQT
jgi:hypothetical protein